MTSLLEKYRPKSLDDVVGNRKQAEEVVKFLRDYRKGKPLMIYGQIGSGKNLVIELAASELGWELAELTASDFRDYESIRTGILKSATQQSLMGKGKIILIDEVDVPDTGMIRGIKEVIKESSFPVVLMTSNPYIRQLYELRKISILIRFDKLRTDSIKSFIERVAKEEKIKYDDKSLGQLARIADGDIRSALIDMEALGEVSEKTVGLLGSRRFEQSIFETLKIVFKSRDSENSRMAMEQSEKEPDEIFWWLEENIFREYDKPEDIAMSYSYLAKADYFNSLVIRRQSWGLKKYSQDMMVSISIAKKEPYRKFVLYQSPRFFSRFGKARTAEMNDVLEKVSKGTHVSKRIAQEYIPLLRKLAKANKLESLNEKEIMAVRES